jgi:thioredoxin-related protein
MLFSQDWVYDFDEAKDLAIKDNKIIVLVFQGSDWCSPCIKLDRNIWQNNEFNKIAKENFVMLLADFPRKKKNALNSVQQEKNTVLAEMFNKNGFFPLVVVLDKNGDVLGQTGYKKVTPTDYADFLISMKIND